MPDCFHTKKMECEICFKNLLPDEQRLLACGHSFHSQCVVPWIIEHHTCPKCRIAEERLEEEERRRRDEPVRIKVEKKKTTRPVQEPAPEEDSCGLKELYTCIGVIVLIWNIYAISTYFR